MKTTASKAAAFVLTAVPAWGTFAHPSGITAGEWWLLVGILCEGLLIFLVPNVPKPEPWVSPAREGGATGASFRDRGAVDLNGALTLVVLVLLVVFLLRALALI